MRIASWNVNGLRAVHKKNFLEWMQDSKLDVVCLQEIKCNLDQVSRDPNFTHPHGYNSHWYSAEKAGYSGLLIYTKKDPTRVQLGLGDSRFDSEGRWLEMDIGNLTIINSYFPNSQRDHARLPYKLEFCDAAERRLEALRAAGREVTICGDFNIAHKDIDLKNPKTNTKNAGFLPEERAWLDHFTSLGWVDTFREFEKGGDHYTWWSYRPGVREKNVGWRLDYFFANLEIKSRLKKVEHLPNVMGSDHCPLVLTLHS